MAEEKKENIQPEEQAKEEKAPTEEKSKEPAKEEVKEERPEEPEKKVEQTEEKEQEEVEVPKKFEKIVKEIEDMKVVDLAELVKILEKKFGVSAAAPVAVAAAPAAAGQEGSEEKAEYDVILKAVGDKKIEVIKAVRDATSKGLKEAKDMVDAAASEPQVVREKVKKEEAEEIKKKFEAAGATIELK